MPDHIAQTYHDNEAKAQESVDPCRSVWMDHWLQKSCNSASRVHGHFDLHDGSKVENWDTKHGSMLIQVADPKKATRLDIDLGPANIFEYGNAWRCPQGDLEIASDIPNSAKVDRIEIGGAEITSKTLAKKPTNLRNAKSEWQSFPMFSFNKKIDGVFAPKKDLAVYDIHQSRCQTDDNYHRFQPESVSQSPVKFPYPNRSFERKSLPLPRHYQDDLIGSSSNPVSYGFKSGGKPVRSLMYRNDETDKSRMALSSKEYCIKTNFTSVDYEPSNYHGYSTFLVCDKKVDSQVVTKNSECSYLGQKDGTLQLHNSSVNNSRFPISAGEQGRKNCRFSGHGCHFLQRMPTCSVHDVETLKVSTIVDSVEHIHGDHLELSQKSHHLLIIDKIDANSSKQNQMIKHTSTDFKGNEFQPLGNANDNGGKKDNGDINIGSLGLKNESSAETDIMDANVYRARNSFRGSSSSNKDFMAEQNSAKSQATVASPREKNGSRKTEIELPDINQGPPASVVAEVSVDNKDLSTSRTESLGLEHLFSFVEHSEYSNSSAQQDVRLGLPSSRWVKRLKLSPSDSLARGTKSSKAEDASSSGKLIKLFRKNMNYSSNSSESTFCKRHGKGQMETDKSVIKDRESLNLDSVKKCHDLTLSHPWIQRLCRKQAVASRPKSAALVVLEPQSSKAALDEFQRKQFPSIAAMALMGKATNCFQPCEFRKRGSVIVWNTDGF